MKFKAIFSNIKDKICGFFKKDKKLFFAIIACFVILVPLLISTISDLGKAKSKSNAKTQVENTEFSILKYSAEIENKLENIITKLDGVKSVSVFVMVDATPTITYLTETTEKIEKNGENSVSELTTTVVFEKNGSIQTPVVVTTIAPKVTGVLIVINKINQSTIYSIKKSISVVLNIDESCISILQES